VERALLRFDPRLVPIVLSKFEIDYGLTKEDIARSPELFGISVQQIFRFGATYVEREIVKELERNFAPRDRHYGSFSEAVNDIRG
jgi:hypothetical protein